MIEDYNILLIMNINIENISKKNFILFHFSSWKKSTPYNSPE